MSALAQILFFFVFLLLAGWDLRGSAWEGARVWKRPLQAGALLAAVTLLGCAAIFLTSARSSPSEIAGRLLHWGLSFEIPLIVFLAAVLRNESAGGPRTLMRPFPLLDLLRLRRTIRGGQSLLFHPARIAEAAGYLVLVFAFVAVWMRVAVRFFGARTHDTLVGLFPTSPEDVDLAFEISIYLPILLAPFIEEVIFRGYIQERLTRLFRAAGSGRGAAGWSSVAAICLTSAVWALQHGGMVQPEWVKWVQIFGLGVILGMARIRLGLEACMALHLLHNALAWLVYPR